MGQGLGRALVETGKEVVLIGRQPRNVLPGLKLHVGPWPEVIGASDLVFLATPDDVIADVARRLAAENAVRSSHVVFHVSGTLDHAALEALRPAGAALGSFHPLQSVTASPAASGELLGAHVGIEGDRRAVEVARSLGRALQMIPVVLPPGSKPAYHAAAVMVSNYTVALVAIAERIVQQAGLEDSRGMFHRLLEGTVANLATAAPGEALTGPVLRGDSRTVAAHLHALSGPDRELYRLLGLEALSLAEGRGMAPDQVRTLRAVLQE